MTVRHLKIFVAVADCGSMSGAAKKLYISQPTVSQAVSELEKYYGIRLFERLSQKLFITDNGLKLLSYARHIIDSFDKMENAMKSSENTQTLKIGCSVSVGTYLLYELLDKSDFDDPNCKINVSINNTSTIEKMVFENHLDVGIVEGIVTNPELIITPVCYDELVLVCSPKHHLASKEQLFLTDLEGENFISREKGSADRNQLEKLLEEQNITLNRCWNSTNTEAIKNAVIHGRGVAVLSSMLIKKELTAGELVVLELYEMPLLRTIHLIYHKNKFISNPIKKIISTCDNYYLSAKNLKFVSTDE